MTHFWPLRANLGNTYCLSHLFTSWYQLVQWLEWFWVYGIWYFSRYCQYSKFDPLFNENSFILIILTHFWPLRENLGHICCTSHSFTSWYQLVQSLEWFWGYCFWYFPRYWWFSIFTLFLTATNEIFLCFIYFFSHYKWPGQNLGTLMA